MRALTFGLFLALHACGKGNPKQEAALPKAMEPGVRPVAPTDPQRTVGAKTLLFRGATVLTAAGTRHAPGHVLVENGLITSVGPGEGTPPTGATIVDAAGSFITPGLIDTHSHLGVYPMPAAAAHADGNEMTNPTTPHVWSEHAFWPQDPGLWRAVKGGITTIQVLPGSGNLIGGRSFVAKLKPHIAARLMRFPGAPQGLKMACGENPKRVYGPKSREPMSRMGNVAGYRAAFQKALEYRRQWAKYERDLDLWKRRQAEGRKPPPPPKDPKPEEPKPDDPPDPPARDLGHETLAAVLDGKILVHTHCYRADEMSLMLDLAKEYGFKIRSFHHALEAYKLAARLAQEDVSVSTFVDWWGFKMEAFDGVPQNAALLTQAGARAIIHSDSPREIRHLNQEAAKGQTAGKNLGVDVNEDQALKWVTANPAWALGVEKEVGTLEPGKHADLVVWSAHPFSVYALATQVYIDGELAFDRAARPTGQSDFELGQVDPEAAP